MSDFVTESSLLKRAYIFLEDGEWASADAYFEKVLDGNPECAEAYLGKLLAELKLHNVDELANCSQNFSENANYARFNRYAEQGIRAKVKAYAQNVENNVENARKDAILKNVANSLNHSYEWNKADFDRAMELIKSVGDYKNVNEVIALWNARYEQRLNVVKDAPKDALYTRIADSMKDTSEWTEKEYNDAMQALIGLGGYKQSVQLFKELEEKKANYIEFQAKKQVEMEKLKKVNRKSNVKLFVIIAVFIAVVVAGFFAVTKILMPYLDYKVAVELMESGEYEEAIEKFTELGDYKDSAEKIKETNYRYAGALCEDGEYAEGLSKYMQLYGYKDAAEKLNGYYSLNMLAGGYKHTVALKDDGTVVAVGSDLFDECDVYNWRDIVSVCAGSYHTVGLKSNGKVVAIGDNYDRQCNVSGWTNITKICTGNYHTIGLKSNGTVVAVGWNHEGQCNVSGWTDIVAISAGWDHTVGLKSDGTVVAVGSNLYDQCDVSDWEDIVAVSSGYHHTVGLKADGTVVAVGSEFYGDVSGWTDIVAVSAGNEHAVGLKADGTVVAVGSNYYGQCDVSGWSNIIAVYAGSHHTIGLKSDGTVVAVGWNEDGQCYLYGWGNIKMPNIK